MTDFQRDMEVIMGNVEFINNGTIRFQMNHMDRMVGELDNLTLSDRASNALHRNGIHTIERLTEKMGMYHAKGVGAKSIKEIKNAYMSYYYDQLNDEERKQFWRDTYEATLALAKVPNDAVEALVKELRAV